LPAIVRSIRAKNPEAAAAVGFGERLAGFHMGRRIHDARLDGMDSGISVWFGHPAV